MMVFISYSVLNYTFASRLNFSNSEPGQPNNSGEWETKAWASLQCCHRCQWVNFFSSLMWFYWIGIEQIQLWAHYWSVGLPFCLWFWTGRLIDKVKKGIFIIIIEYCRAFPDNSRQTHHRSASFTFLCAFGGFETRDENVLSKQRGLHLKVLWTES